MRQGTRTTPSRPLRQHTQYRRQARAWVFFATAHAVQQGRHACGCSGEREKTDVGVPKSASRCGVVSQYLRPPKAPNHAVATQLLTLPLLSAYFTSRNQSQRRRGCHCEWRTKVPDAVLRLWRATDYCCPEVPNLASNGSARSLLETTDAAQNIRKACFAAEVPFPVHI